MHKMRIILDGIELSKGDSDCGDSDDFCRDFLRPPDQYNGPEDWMGCCVSELLPHSRGPEEY